jgi:hypothetical protein
MPLNYKHSYRNPLWISGNYSDYTFEAKVYDEGSEYGIYGGRVSKLAIWEDGDMIINYDRGWDFGKYTTSVYDPLVEQLENLPPIPDGLWDYAQQINDEENRSIHYERSYSERIRKFLGW